MGRVPLREVLYWLVLSTKEIVLGFRCEGEWFLATVDDDGVVWSTELDEGVTVKRYTHTMRPPDADDVCWEVA